MHGSCVVVLGDVMSFAFHVDAGALSMSPCNTGVFIVSDVDIGRSPTGVVNGRRRNVSVTRSESRVCPSVRT